MTTTYRTATGATVATGSRTNAFNQTVHVFECGGCDGIRGFKTADQAATAAKQHAERCTSHGNANAIGGAR